MNRKTPRTRRRFLAEAALGVAGMLRIPAPVSGVEGRAVPDGGDCPGVLALQLATRRLDALRAYYGETLDLPVARRASNAIEVHAGGTRITFESRDTGAAYYHFAFNIPENKLAAAKAWLRPRSELIRRPDGGDEYDFRAWNAHSLYFLDPAGNILEFIARHNLRNAADGEFTSRDILYVSEIGLVVDDVAAAVTQARHDLELGVFAGSQSPEFAAVGDDHRLLILVRRGRPWFTQERRRAEVFPTGAVLRGTRAARLAVGALPYDVRAAGGAN